MTHTLSPKKGYGTAVQIEWGLVSIPIRLHLIADDDRTIPARSMFTPVTNPDDGTVEDHPVGKLNYDKITGQPLDVGAEILKKVAVSDGTLVELTDAEIEDHSTLTKGRAEIVTFVPLTDLQANYVIVKPGKWVPEQMKVGKTKVADPTATKAAALLRHAMADRGVAALVMLPTTGGGQYVALFADGTVGWLAYAENVRALDATVTAELTKQEMDLAGKLIDGIGISTPVLNDEAGARIRLYLEAKAGGKAEPVRTVPAAAAAVDLMASLEASIAANVATKKKPTTRKKAS